MTAIEQGTARSGIRNVVGHGGEDTETVVGRHIQAFLANDLETIMADFAPDALLCTPDGALRGPDQIRGFFQQVLPLFPPGETQLDVKQQVVDGELFYVAWSASTPKAEVPLGCDVFIVRNGMLVYQCFGGQVLVK